MVSTCAIVSFFDRYHPSIGFSGNNSVKNVIISHVCVVWGVRGVLIAAICLGALAGVLGFLPLIGATVAVKRVTDTSNFSYATILILAVLGSTLVLAGAVIACVFASRQDVIAFVAAEAGGLVIAAIAFGVQRTFRK